MKTYQEENDELLKFILENRFYKLWKNWRYYTSTPEIRKRSAFDETQLELQITSFCNQHCTYCYWVQFKDLYPRAVDKKDIVLKNLNILLDKIIEDDLYIPEIELFSGEIWHLDYGREVLELFLEKIEKGLHINNIMIPTNGSFALELETLDKIQEYIDRFEVHGIRLILSLSIDGKVIEDKTRPNNDKSIVRDNGFYNNIFLFAKKNNYYFHPMIASTSVKYWIENFQWWVENLAKYDIEVYPALMMLEVRNADWTEESIKDYNNFIKYLIDWHIQKYSNNSIETFVKQLMLITPFPKNGYLPYMFTDSKTIPACTISQALMIRMGDLMITPCHRLSYKKYNYGRLIVKDDKIVGLESNNVPFAIRNLMMNNQYHMGCDLCPHSSYCLKGCFGSQYESNGDPLMPTENVCNFFRKKMTFLVKYYEELGVWKKMEELNSPYLISFLSNNKLLEYAGNILKEDRNE